MIGYGGALWCEKMDGGVVMQVRPDDCSKQII
jgi:hypothetical protein